MIREVISTATRYYVLTNKDLRAFDNSSQTLIDAWDMPSRPCSALVISSLHETHWSIVCKHHLRTHDMTIPHAFSFSADDVRHPTFLSMHEIGVVSGEGEEHHGIQLVLSSKSAETKEVYQLGSDVCVRRMKKNGFMQRISNAVFLADHEQRGIVIMNEKGELVIYDPFGLHCINYGSYQRLLFRGGWLSYLIPHLPLLQRDTDISSLKCCLIAPGTIVLANATSSGSILVLDNRWHWQYFAKRFFLLLIIYNVLCVLLSI